MLLPECNRLSLLINIIWTLSYLVTFLYVRWSGRMTKLGGKFVPSFGTVQSSPGDPLGARKAAGEWCGAAGVVLAGGGADWILGAAKSPG